MMTGVFKVAFVKISVPVAPVAFFICRVSQPLYIISLKSIVLVVSSSVVTVIGSINPGQTNDWLSKNTPFIKAVSKIFFLSNVESILNVFPLVISNPPDE